MPQMPFTRPPSIFNPPPSILTHIDLWWPQNKAFWNLCIMYIKRKLCTQGYHLWHFFSTFDHVTSHDHDLTSPDLFGTWKLKNWKSMHIGMLHIKWKTAVLQCKYVQTSDRSNDWPQADLHWWPQNLAIWNICFMYISHAIICDKYFTVLDRMTSHDPYLTSKDPNWPPDLKNSEHDNY